MLLVYDDPKTIVFSKEGPDGGLDAISGDWKNAFQELPFVHHAAMGVAELSVR